MTTCWVIGKSEMDFYEGHLYDSFTEANDYLTDDSFGSYLAREGYKLYQVTIEECTLQCKCDTCAGLGWLLIDAEYERCKDCRGEGVR
jgi:hypothetical protein